MYQISAEIFLKQGGHEVLLAEDGFDALSKVNDYEPDLIFCDVTMPELGGMQVLAAIQLDANLRKIPFIFVSASAEPERLDEALKLGASAYVTKPFSLAQLRTVLDQFLPNPALSGSKD